MNRQKSETNFLLLLLGGMLILTFFVFRPYLFPLILAIIFAVIFDPIHKKILTLTGKQGIAALLACLIVLFIVILPLLFVGYQIFKESAQLYSFLTSNGGAQEVYQGLTNFLIGFQSYLPVTADLSIDLNEYTKQGIAWVLSHLGSVFANAAKIIVDIFIFLVALYYLFKDGERLKKAVISLSPLRDIHDETIFQKLGLAINSVIKGNLAVAFVQGILTAVGFYFFGVPNAALWGSVASIAALIPGFGTALVVFPAILFLFLRGENVSAFGLTIWGLTAVGLVDNFLGPKLAQRGMRIHPFLILLSILGGIGFFGPFGFLLGPLILSLLFALLEIYLVISNKQDLDQAQSTNVKSNP